MTNINCTRLNCYQFSIFHFQFRAQHWSPFIAAAPILIVLLLSAAPARADWPTHRGNAARTGNLDEKPGPASPRVLWVHTSKDHFVASPAIDDGRLFVSTLGVFNSGAVHALAIDPAAAKRGLWSKLPPVLKQPVVCSPAVAEGKVVFGDGMHQNAGAVLRCVFAESGSPLWQLSLPGDLIHIEGTPTITAGRVIFGAGHGGVLCVELSKAVLDSKELSPAEIQALLDKRWKELQARYEEDKKKDPDFAVPPSEDQLKKPQPKIVWQQGAGKWHVDAPLAVSGDRVLVASAFLDKEKTGERALLCLSAADGGAQWSFPLKMNPWGGPSVAGDLVIVGCSSIRFDPKEISRGRGEVVAVGLSDGKERWRRTMPGGVIASVAVSGGTAVFTCTDGKVRAVDAAKGPSKWTYDAQVPFFAGPAIAGDMVYAADLLGNLHSIGLADGSTKWKLNLAQETAGKATGHVYGSPVVHGGRIYVATCEPEGSSAEAQRAVVCLGEK